MSSHPICRLCLCKSPALSSLFMGNRAQMLETLTSIKVCENDASTQVCLTCIYNLKLAFKIQQNIKRADEKLKEMTQNEDRSADKAVDTEDASNISAVVQEDVNKQQCTTDNCTVDLSDPAQHSKPSCYKCETCNRSFFYESLYNTHMRIAHNKESALRESKRVSLAIKDYLSKSDSPGPYVCNECHRTYVSWIKFKKHVHQKKMCPICDKEYSASNLKRHIENHTAEPQICELCGAKFKNKDGLRTHFFYSHNHHRYKCDQCDKVFQKKNKRDLHIKRDHDENPDFVCDTCGKKFYTSGQLGTHIKMTHQKLRPYVCEFCNRGYSSRNTLKTHRRQHTHEAPYKCELCSESFRQKVSLRAHRKSKHNIIEEIICQCKKCGKGFSSTIALNTHLRISCC